MLYCVCEGMLRPRALTIPRVMVFWKPKGLPMAIAMSPTFT